MDMAVHDAHLQCLNRPDEVMGPHGTGVTEAYEPHVGAGTQSQSSEEQPVLLSAEPYKD